MFNPFFTVSRCLQVLLNPLIQELEKLVDVSLKMAKLFLRTIRPSPKKILSLLLEMPSPTLVVSPISPSDCQQLIVWVKVDWKEKDHRMQLNWSLWESEKFLSWHWIHRKRAAPRKKNRLGIFGFVFHSVIPFLIHFYFCIYVSLRRRILREDGNSTRRKGRTIGMSKLLYSDSSQSKECDALGEGNRNVRNAVRIRQSRSKSAVRYPEDSYIGNSLKRMAKGRYSEDDDYVAYENVDPLKQKENGIVKRRSAQEAAKRLKRNFDVSSNDEEDEGEFQTIVHSDQEF